MITNTTPDRISQLGQTIAEASEELEKHFQYLSAEADEQMASAAQMFITEHPNRRPLFAAYVEAHEALLKATVAASNIRELSKRATTLRSKCTWWRNVMGCSQQHSDITAVCERSKVYRR